MFGYDLFVLIAFVTVNVQALDKIQVGKSVQLPFHNTRRESFVLIIHLSLRDIFFKLTFTFILCKISRREYIYIYIYDVIGGQWFQIFTLCKTADKRLLNSAT